MFANFTKFISDLKSDCKAGYKAVVFGYDTATSATDEQIPQVARLLDLPLTAVKVGRTAALVIHSKWFKVGALASAAVSLCVVAACLPLWADVVLSFLAIVPAAYAYDAWTGSTLVEKFCNMFK